MRTQQHIDADLLACIEHGDLDGVRELVGRATNLVNSPGVRRDTALIWAAAHAQAKLVRFLLPLSRWDDVSSLEENDSMDWAVNLRASIEGAALFREESGADSRRAVGALNWSLFHGEIDSVNAILEHIPDGHFHRPEHARAAVELLWAAVADSLNAKPECLRAILGLIDFKNAPVDVNLAFREIARAQRPDLLLILLPHADLRACSRHGATALMLACGLRFEDTQDSGHCAQILVDAGCDLDAKDHTGQNAAQYAVAFGGSYAGVQEKNMPALDVLGVEVLKRAREQRIDGLQALRRYGIRPNLSALDAPATKTALPRTCAWLEAAALELAADQAVQAAKKSAVDALPGSAIDRATAADTRTRRL